MEGAGHDPRHAFLGYVCSTDHDHHRPTSLTGSPTEHLVFAYLAQCRCDPANTMVYFTHLVAIVDTMTDSDSDAGESVPDELRSFIASERKQRGRFTMEEHAAYARVLGFGRDNSLGVELDGPDDGPADDAFIAQAWRRARQRTWLTAADQAEKRAQLDDALRLVAEQRGSVALVEVWREEKGSGMAPETAYQLLGVPAEADETVLLEAYYMRVSDISPSTASKLCCWALTGLVAVVD